MVATNYLIMMKQLLYMRENLPELLDNLKAVQKKFGTQTIILLQLVVVQLLLQEDLCALLK